MSIVNPTRTELPAWLHTALEEGECTEGILNKRSEHRLVWMRLATVKPHSDVDSGPASSVKIANVSSQGVGLISRQPLEPGLQYVLYPDGATEEATTPESVMVRVMHCTGTIQGYKVGCVLVL